MIEEIEEYWEDENQTPKPSETRENEQLSTNEVFIVHGRDEGAKNEVARFIEKLDLVPVILHEQANQGRTIIEKFEEHAQVGFTVALLTPDDVGALQDDKNNRKPRARQNVIFEFGYFIGKLGRKRVCALVQDDVEKPSDYDGVLYIPFDDSGGWKMGIIKELKTAGFKIDANRAFQT
ncbi:MAG: nucleotide-binding protein [Bryobacterales bacterium]|nr:nucleotide-binding protein [Bryobacterales bacterium]